MARQSENTNPEAENALNAAQVLFTANPDYLAAQKRHFWEAQERVFEAVEKFSSAWFQRRKSAVVAMVDMGRRVSSEGRADPAGAMKEIAGLQAQSIKLLTEDAQALSEMLTQCAGVLGKSELKALEEAADTVSRATKSSKSEPV